LQLPYRLLDKFRELFEGKVFLHRSSTQGDHVAMQFFEDLYTLNRSQKYVNRVDQALSVLNVQNVQHGIKARRGDGTFGEVVPNVSPIADPGYTVRRGPIATIEIGIEVKIIQKAMIRQVGRVISDLEKQILQFKKKSGSPITIAVIGINHAPHYVSYEGTKAWPTTGKGKYKHPFQEADAVEKRLRDEVGSLFDELIILPFSATNSPPYEFRWMNEKKTKMDYGAALARVSTKF
jgi:hypothetical protein